MVSTKVRLRTLLDAKAAPRSVPGHRLSLNIVQLLGKSEDGRLEQLINALDCLHSLDIVFRDLRADNLFLSEGGKRLVVCGLESRWGEWSVPEGASQGRPGRLGVDP